LKLRPLPWPLICWLVTPATVVEREKIAAVVGRLSISVRLTTVPTCVRPVSTIGAACVTVTVSARPPVAG
jgi:hypothetical protein